MIPSALLVPAATSVLSSVASSLLTAQPEPAPSSAAPSNQANVERHTRAQPRMQSQQLTSLGQTLLQGAATLFPTALYNGGTSDKAKGAGLVMGGAAAEGIGKRLTTSDGMVGKAIGVGLVWGGRTAQELGKGQYNSASSNTNNTGNYAYSPSSWGSKSAT